MKVRDRYWSHTIDHESFDSFLGFFEGSFSLGVIAGHPLLFGAERKWKGGFLWFLFFFVVFLFCYFPLMAARDVPYHGWRSDDVKNRGVQSRGQRRSQLRIGHPGEARND